MHRIQLWADLLLPRPGQEWSRRVCCDRTIDDQAAVGGGAGAGGSDAKLNVATTDNDQVAASNCSDEDSLECAASAMFSSCGAMFWGKNVTEVCPHTCNQCSSAEQLGESTGDTPSPGAAVPVSVAVCGVFVIGVVIFCACKQKPATGNVPLEQGRVEPVPPPRNGAITINQAYIYAAPHPDQPQAYAEIRAAEAAVLYATAGPYASIPEGGYGGDSSTYDRTVAAVLDAAVNDTYAAINGPHDTYSGAKDSNSVV